jgi:His-Xaa-Ser system protein HxsD
MSETMSFGYQIENQRDVILEVDETLYPLDAIYGTCYLFVDRCYVFLERTEDKKVRIRLRAKSETSPEVLEALVGEFANELLNQVLRFKVSEATAQIREYTMARAFVSSPAQASIDALLAELDAEELEEDDLEISVPWKE